MTSKAARKKLNTSDTTGPHFEALEPRLLLSADPLGGAAGTGADIPADEDPGEIDEPGVLEALLEALAPTHTDAPSSPGLPDLPPPVDLEALAGLSSSLTADDSGAGDDLELTQPPDFTAPSSERIDTREVLFVDARLPDLQRLLEDLDLADETRNIDIVVLDPHRDGVEQITATLQDYTDLNSVHFVSHGADGRVQLGDTWLNADNLDDYEETVKSWQQALANDADLLIYGCNLAETDTGQAFVDRLSTLTEADVAASDDITGAAQHGGDWALEYRSGELETRIAFTHQFQKSWEASLAPAPGGVDSGITLWLKADAGVATAGGGVSQWVNQVANGTLSNVQQGSNSERPDLNPLALNFNPVVTFDGIDDNLRDVSVWGTDLFAADKASIVTVVRMNDPGVILQWEENTNNRVNLEDAAGSPRFDFGDDVPPDRLTGSGMTAGYHILNVQAVPDSPANLQILVDGKLDVQNGASSATPLDPAVNGTFVLGEWAGSGVNAGMDLAEVIVYDTDLSGVDQQRIESYLALKYGITLDQSTSTNYLDASGNVIWDATANTGYGNDIAGIGQDDGSTLNRLISQSISNDSILTVGLASDQDDGEFLFWANNDGALTETAAGTPGAVGQQLQRVWKVDETGELGTTTLAFDLNALPVSGTVAGDFSLIIDSDTDFSTGATLVSASAYAGGVVTFTGVNLDDGQFFALGTEANLTPVANASAAGPYVIDEGESVSFDGGASSDPDGTITAYEWDIGNDGTFEASGMGVMFNWTGLTGAGVNDDGTHDVALRVTDNDGTTNTEVFTLTVNNVAPAITVTGPASVDEDAVYALNLTSNDPGDDTITWNVNWGDGHISSAPSTGSTTTVTHTYTHSGFTYNIVVSAQDEDGTWTNSDLLVGSWVVGMDDLFRFDGETGTAETRFEASGDLNRPYHAIAGPDGNYYVSGYNSDNIVRYDSTGNNPTLFASGNGLDRPDGLAFGPDGNLYVSNFGGDNILKFDGSTQAFLGSLGGGGPLNGPTGLAFGPDGDLYVASWNNGRLVKFDGSGPNGQTPTTVIASGLGSPEQIVFDGAGDLYIATGSGDDVKRWDGSTLTPYFSSPSLNFATGLTFGPDGWLYISSYTDRSVIRFDGVATDEVFVAPDSGGLSEPEHLSFTPDHQVSVNHCADTPTVTGAVTAEDTQTSSGLVIDRNAADGPETTHFKITNIVNGTLYKNDGSTVINEGDFITSAEANLGLKFTPSLDFNGLATFDVQASTTGDDADLSSATAANITVNPVNDDPTGGGSLSTTSLNDDAGSTKLFSDLTVNDVDTGESDLVLKITLSNAAAGTITGGGFTDQGGGVYTRTGLTVAQANTALDNVQFTPTDNTDSSGSFSTDISVDLDDQGGAGYQSVLSATTVTITRINDAPSLGNTTLTLDEGQTVTVTAAMLSAADVDDTDANITFTVSGVNGGHFAFSAAPVVPITSFTQAQITGGQVVFVDDGDETAPGFDIQVSDASAADGPVAATVNFTNLNDAPSLGNTTLTLNEGQTVTITSAMLSAADADDTAPNITFTVSGVSGGHFALAATPAVPITSFTQADMTASLVVFVDDGDEIAPSFDIEVSDGSTTDGPVAASVNFTHQNDAPLGLPGITGIITEDQVLSANAATVSDAEGLGPFSYQWLRNGGAIGGATASTYTLGDADVGALMSVQLRYTDGQGTVETLTSAQTAAVANVNDAPVLGNNRLAIADGATVVLAGAELSAADVDDSNAALLFSVTNLSGGQFELASNPGVGVSGFTQAQVGAGQVQFVHDGSGTAPAYEVSVSDGALVDGPQAAVINFGSTGINPEPPPPDIDPIPDVKPPPKVDPPPDTSGDDADEPDTPPEDEAPAPSDTGGESETDPAIEGVPGGRTLLADDTLALPAFVIDAPLDRNPDNDSGTTDLAPQNSLQKTFKAIATRPPALQALLGGVSTAYGLSWGDLSALDSEEYRQQLDRLRDDVAGDIFVDQTVVGSTVAVSTGLSVGYVLWLVRGGVLLSSVLSSLPAWRLVDPLPVLAYVKNRPEDDRDEEDSLETLVKKKTSGPDKHSDEENSE